MRFSTLISLAIALPFVTADFPMYNFDCADYPGPCNNDCYAAYSANKPTTLNWEAGEGNSGRRDDSGCGASPCGTKMEEPNSGDSSCDEYPFASVIEGGTGSLLRCTDPDQNSLEGSKLGGFLTSDEGCGGKKCTFTVGFSDAGGGQTPYCLDGGGANDGYEYVYEDDEYKLHSRDIKPRKKVWKLHKPDPALFFPPHLRREFLLDDGTRVVSLSRDLNATYDIVRTIKKNTSRENRIVRELFGKEKTPAYQPSEL